MDRPRRHDDRLWRVVVASVVVLCQVFVGIMPAAAAPLAPSSVAAFAPAVPLVSPAERLALREAAVPAARQAASAGALYFTETGFAIEEPRFIDYFNRRGGVATSKKNAKYWPTSERFRVTTSFPSRRTALSTKKVPSKARPRTASRTRSASAARSARW